MCRPFLPIALKIIAVCAYPVRVLTFFYTRFECAAFGLQLFHPPRRVAVPALAAGAASTAPAMAQVGVRSVILSATKSATRVDAAKNKYSASSALLLRRGRAQLCRQLADGKTPLSATHQVMARSGSRVLTGWPPPVEPSMVSVVSAAAAVYRPAFCTWASMAPAVGVA